MEAGYRLQAGANAALFDSISTIAEEARRKSSNRQAALAPAPEPEKEAAAMTPETRAMLERMGEAISCVVEGKHQFAISPDCKTKAALAALGAMIPGVDDNEETKGQCAPHCPFWSEDYDRPRCGLRLHGSVSVDCMRPGKDCPASGKGE